MPAMFPNEDGPKNFLAGDYNSSRERDPGVPCLENGVNDEARESRGSSLDQPKAVRVVWRDGTNCCFDFGIIFPPKTRISLRGVK